MSNRAAVKRRIVFDVCPVALAAVDLGVTGRDAELVPAAYGLPPDEANQTCAYFGGTNSAVEGQQEQTGLKRNDPPTDDTFTLKGTIDAFGFDSDQEAEEAAERILTALNTVLKRCQWLLDRTNGAPTEDGVPDPTDTGPYKNTKAWIGSWKSELYAPVGDTHVCRITFDIDCRTHDS